MDRSAACSQRSGQNIKCTMQDTIQCSDLPQVRLEVLCMLHFSDDAKLGRSYKLSADKINPPSNFPATR